MTTDDNTHDLPDDWTLGARSLVGEVLDETPDLQGAALASLWQVGSLISSADALDAVARAAGFVALGSTGQPVVHPAQIEARLARTAAAGILARLRPDAGLSRTTHARRAARARHGRTSTALARGVTCEPPSRSRDPLWRGAPLVILRAVMPPRVTTRDATSGGPSVRACIDAVAALPEVGEARAWAEGNTDRLARVRFAVAGLNSRTYAAAAEALS